eukprot:28859_1
MAFVIASLFLCLLHKTSAATTTAANANFIVNTPDATTTTTEEPNMIDLPLPFQIEGDITECGQALTGLMYSYFGPQVYRFDFAAWSSSLLLPDEAEDILGGYYRCEEVELEQAQVFAQMVENDILSAVNGAATCGTTNKVQVLSAVKQVVAGVNYRVHVEACDGLQLALMSFFVPLPSNNEMQKPTKVSFIAMIDATFTIDPCNTQYPLHIEPVISAEHYNDKRFFDDQFLPLYSNNVTCDNGHNQQWSFNPNTTRFGTEYIISWIGVQGGAVIFNQTAGNYRVEFECAASATSKPTTTTGIEIPLPFQIEGDITTCGQVLSGVMSPYFGVSGGDPEVYRFDFEEWSATNLLTQQRVSQGYYKCIATQLEQAQLFGIMAEAEILSAVNEAASCGTTKKVNIISAAKQVVSGSEPGVNYTVNAVACDGEQVVLVSFFVPLPTSNMIEKPSGVEAVSVRDSTFTIDPCNTDYPLRIEPLISIAHYGDRRFFDDEYLGIHNSVQCDNEHNWQWEFTPNVTRYGTEYIVSWLGVDGDDALDAYNDTDGSYSVRFGCAGESSTTTEEPIVTRHGTGTTQGGSSSTSTSGEQSKEESGLESVPAYVWLILLGLLLLMSGVFGALWLSSKKQLELLESTDSRYQQLQNDEAHPL